MTDRDRQLLRHLRRPPKSGECLLVAGSTPCRTCNESVRKHQQTASISTIQEVPWMRYKGKFAWTCRSGHSSPQWYNHDLAQSAEFRGCRGSVKTWNPGKLVRGADDQFFRIAVFQFPGPGGTVKIWHRSEATGQPGEVRLDGEDAPLWPRVSRSPAFPTWAWHHPRRATPSPTRRQYRWGSVARKVQLVDHVRKRSKKYANSASVCTGRFWIVSVKGTKKEGLQKKL